MTHARSRPGVAPDRCSGFILLPVALALSLIASIAYLSNRDSGQSVAMVATGADAEKARYAAEAGLEHVNYMVQQKGCGGSYPQERSAPLDVSDFGGASYLAYAGSASGSPVQLTSTGKYNGTSETLVRSNVIVFQPTLQTFTVQPDTLDGKDTYLSSRNPAKNYGGEPTIKLKRDDFHALIQFDTSVFPAGSRPVNKYGSTPASLERGAQLSLYQTRNVGGAAVQSAHLMQVGWTEGKGPTGATDGATFTTSNGNTAWPTGQIYYSTALDAETTTDDVGWKSWNVTDAATAWLTGAVPNNGVWFVSSGAKKDVEFVSSEEPLDFSLRPKLTLNYLLPCGASAPQRATLPATRDTELDSSNPLASKATAAWMSVSATRVQRALVAFDTSSIPVGSSVSSARLRLFLSDASPNAASTSLPLTVNAVDQPWVETASWTAPLNLSGVLGSVWGILGGGSFRSTPVTTTTLPKDFREGSWVEFDIAPLVQEWVAGTTNLGVVIRNAGAVSDELRFATREADPTRAPQLVVTYR